MLALLPSFAREGGYSSCLNFPKLRIGSEELLKTLSFAVEIKGGP